MNGTRSVRKPMLPVGWYPRNRDEIAAVAKEWAGKGRDLHAASAVSPHAGWAFSGRLSALSVRSLRDAETIAVVGGHLPGNSPVLFADEDEIETKAGTARADAELLLAVKAELREAGLPPPEPDSWADNSVEVLLPMVVVLKPGAKILWMRSPPGYAARELGSALSRAAGRLGRSVACLGSTDLTHYGPSYGFMPAGSGPKAENWVRNVNDKGFVDALMAMDCDKALAHASRNYSACSAGAAVTALAFAIGEGADKALLLEYATSLDSRPDDSFVGYASIAFVADGA